MYFETPNFVSNSLHLISIITTPIHLIGFYCILFKTPESMKSVKWGMFHVHFWCTLMDWSLTVITIPYLLSPVAAGVPLGFANVLGISTDFQCYFALTSVAAQGMAFVLIFENRYFLIFARNTLWRYIRVVFIIINYCAVFCVFLPLLTMIPEQTEARKAVLKILPDLPEALDVKLIFVLSTDISYILISAVFMESFLSTEAAIFVVLLWTNFKLTRSAQHSFKTLKLQKKFLLAMYIQAAVMFFNLVIPVSYFIFSTVSKLHNQTANNLSILVLSLNGIASTTIMLWVHKPFREACFDLFRCENKMSNTSNLSVLRF